ncbi:MAG: ATP-binding protein [Anaerolineales bacterium]
MPKKMLLALADSELSRQLGRKVFEPAGYKVTSVLSGQDLQKSLRTAQPDLLVMGEKLPDGDSFELASNIRNSHPNLPIVFLGKKQTPQSLERALKAGGTDYVALPTGPKAIIEATQRALARKKHTDSWLRKETRRVTGTLQRRIDEMETILGQVSDGVLVLDEEDRIIMVNPAFRRDFGLEDKPMEGSPVESLFQDPQVLQAIKEKSLGGERLEVQNTQGRYFNVRISRIQGVGTVVNVYDITYLKELDRLRRDFVNTVSHDLRSPLTAILGYVELIERAGELNTQQTEFIKRVKTSMATTTSLVDDLLNLGRVEVGLVGEVIPVDLYVIVSTVFDTLQPRVKEKSQTIELNNPDSLPPVLGSRRQLTQVVDNLIGNAIKYTPPGGAIQVKLNEEENQVILNVQDNGPGIPLEEQGRIFEKFYRASNVDESIPGTGLGLAIVKTIVDNHHGRIWVDSKSGEGSVFTVVLPVAKEAKDE